MEEERRGEGKFWNLAGRSPGREIVRPSVIKLELKISIIYLICDSDPMKISGSLLQFRPELFTIL